MKYFTFDWVHCNDIQGLDEVKTLVKGIKTFPYHRPVIADTCGPVVFCSSEPVSTREAETLIEAIRFDCFGDKDPNPNAPRWSKAYKVFYAPSKKEAVKLARVRIPKGDMK